MTFLEKIIRAGRWVAVAAVVGCSTVAMAEEADWGHFPIGLYSVEPPDSHYQFVHGVGADLVHTYGMGGSLTPEALEKTQVYLDRAAEHELKVMVNLHTRNWVHKEGGLEEFKQFVRRFKDHPAVGMWYLYDEPDPHATVEELQPFYQFLKQETPKVPVSMALHWSENWRSYTGVTDIILNDFYPIKDEVFPTTRVELMNQFTRNAISTGKPVMPVLQCFNWASLAPAGATTYKDRPVEGYRYPNTTELRYWHFASLAMGVEGLFYWSYYHGERFDEQWMKGTFGPAVQEVRSFVDQLETPSEPTWSRRDTEQEYYAAYWEDGGGEWLVLVNDSDQAQGIRLTLDEGLVGQALVPFGLTRDVTLHLDSSTLSVELQPYETMIWQIRQVPEPSSTAAVLLGGAALACRFSIH